MSWIVAGITAGTAIIGGIGRGISAMGNEEDVIAGRAAAYGMKKQKLDLLGDVKTQAVTGATEQAELGFAGAELGYDVAQSQFAGGVGDVSMGTQMGMRGIQAGAATAASRSGLATSGTIEQQTKTQTGDLMAKYKSDMTKLFETRDFAARRKDLASQERGLTISTAKEKADLAYRSGEISAEDAYQSTLTELESQPTTFLEGIFG